MIFPGENLAYAPREGILDALPADAARNFRTLSAVVLPFDWCVVHGIRTAAHLIEAAHDRREHTRYLRLANERADSSATPRPADVAAAWRLPSSPRPPAAALLLGEQLLAVSAPSAPLHRMDPATHRCHLSSRGGGLKEWLRHAAPSVPYSTAMRYRRLASLLRRYLALSPAIPLAWLLPSAPPPADLTPSAPLRRCIFRARRDFNTFLAANPSLARIQRRLEADLGIAAARLGLTELTAYRDCRGLRVTPPPEVPAPRPNQPALLHALRHLPPRRARCLGRPPPRPFLRP